MTNRLLGLGSSDAAAACGQSRYRSALALYLEKLGELEGDEENEPMRWGKLLEPVVLAEFSRRTGLTLLGKQIHVQHPRLPFMWSTLDSRVSDAELVEAKTAGYWAGQEWGEDGTDSIPAEIICQTSHQMACTGAKLVHVPALIGGQSFRIYRVQRNEGLIARLEEIETEFWRCVQAHEPPVPDWSDSTTPRLLRALYGVHEGQIITLDGEAVKQADAYQKAAGLAKDWEEVKQESRARLLGLMHGAGLAKLPDGRSLTQKEINVRAHMRQASSYVRLTIHDKK